MGVAAYNRGTAVLQRALDAVTAEYTSREDRAVAKITLALEHGIILCAYNALDHEETNVGPYQEAIDRGYRYVVIGWRNRCEQREHRSARSAALDFVQRVGSSRANEAVKKAVK